MNKKTSKRIKNALKLLLKVFVIVLYFIAISNFFRVDEMCEKMEYGFVVLLLTILFFSKE